MGFLALIIVNTLAMNIRLSEEDVVAYDRKAEAVALSDGSGYAGSLNVYHELHCVVSASIIVAHLA